MPYPLPNVTVDLAIFAIIDERLNVLLMQRGAEPFSGVWALPGGYIHLDEDADLAQAAARVLMEKTAVAAPFLEQVCTFGDAGRDPRGWTVSVAYMALIAADAAPLISGGNASDVKWHPISGSGVEPTLAFDHAAILETAISRLHNKVEYTSLPVHLLPGHFTLPDLQVIYETILGRKMEKSAFRKRIAEADFIEPVEGAKRPASNRPAQIYKLKNGQETVFFNRLM